MSQWIQRLQRERQKESQRQAQFAEVFPTRAESIWEKLCETIVTDLDELQRTFPDAFPGAAPEVEERGHRLTVRRALSFPSYQLKLALDIPGQKIIVEQYLRRSDHSRPSESKTEVLLSLDGRREHVQLSLDEEILSPEKFSEWCLCSLLE